MQPLSGSNKPLANAQSLTTTERERISSGLRSGEAHQGGRPQARRQSIDNGEAPLHLRQQVADLAAQVAQLRTKDDLEGVPGALSLDLQQHLQHQRRYEKAATADMLGSQVWKRMRFSQLNNTPGGQVAAAQYGLGFAHDDISGKASVGKLDIGHEMNGYYQRLTPAGKTENLCHQLYQLRYPQALQQHRLFINSEFMANKVVEHFLPQHPAHGDLKSEFVAPGIMAVSCEKGEDWQALDRLVDKFGARPSAYQVARNAVVAQGKLKPLVNDPRVQNHLAVNALRASDPQNIPAQLRGIPSSLSTSVLASADADMIDALTQILAHPQVAQHHQQNPLLAQGLQGIRFIAGSMPALATDSTRFGNAHRALMEEMQVVLSAIRPYTANAFKSFASQRLREALSPQQAEKLQPIEPFLFSSGMQALTEGMELALNASHSKLAPLTHGDKNTQFYYEAQEFANSLHSFTDGADNTPAFFTSLSDSFVPHPSQPEHNWSVEDIIAGINQQLAERKDKTQPLNVVIDTTIEKEGELALLMRNFSPALAGNELRLLLCKSHQKFGNLGATKVLGGNLTLVAAKTPENSEIQQKLRHYEQSQNWYANDENQLLTHLTRAAVSHEPAMLQKAIDNGNFVVQHCFNGVNGHARFAAHDPQKPFSMFHACAHQPEQRYPSFALDAHLSHAQTLSINPVNLINENVIRARGSFGFTESNIGSISSLPGYNDIMIRLSHGIENENESIERTWMLSREMQLDRPALTLQSALDLVTGLTHDALTPAQQDRLRAAPPHIKLRQVALNEAMPLSDRQRNQADVTTLRAGAAGSQHFTLNKIASVVNFLAHLIESNDLLEEVAGSSDRAALHTLLSGFIDSGMQGVSRTAREQAISLQCELAMQDMQSGDAAMRRSGADILIAALDKSHISPGVGIMKESVPDTAWHELPQGIKDKLTEVIFDRLDVHSQLEFLNNNLKLPGRTAFTQTCAMRLAGALKNGSAEETQQHWQSTLKEAMLRRGII